MTVTRAGIAGTLAVLIVAAVCVRLGVWQLDRLEQRRDRNATMAARMNAPVVPVSAVLGDTAGIEYRRVTVAGEADVARSVVIAARYRNGSPGVHVLTPVRLADGGVIMLDRGWVPAPDAATIDLERVPAPRADRVIGMIRRYSDTQPSGTVGTEDDAERGAVDSLPAERRRVLYRVTQSAVEALVPYPVLPIYVQALPGDGPAEIPIPPDPPALTRGPHLSYAIQWFSFAAIAIIGWGVLVARSGGRRGSPERMAADVS